MSNHDNAKSSPLDHSLLARLTAELEVRYRLNPTVSVADLLSDLPDDQRATYAEPLASKLTELKHQLDLHSLRLQDDSASDQDELGMSFQQSLMATVMFEHQMAGELPDASDVTEPIDLTASNAASDATVQLAPATVAPQETLVRRETVGLNETVGSHPSSLDGTSVAPVVAPEKIEQFKIIRELGAGAFGVVYLAEDEQLRRKVAIKMPKVSDPRRTAAYLDEARKAAAIDCKGIVPIYHVGSTDKGIPFVVQKLIDGPSMRLLLTRHTTLPPAHAATLMRDVAIALSAAHKLGIYHRDLKPDNVLIDSSGVPWIADFGLAISENEQAKRKGEVAGTLIYMSPEQIQGRADLLDGRSDIWALGIMLYELLVGKPPFVGRSRSALMDLISHQEPAALDQASPGLAGLSQVFARCCAKRPDDRYPSVDDLAADLTALLAAGLSDSPTDGRELKADTPLSQYASTEGRSQNTVHSRSLAGGTATLLNQRSGTLVDSNRTGLESSQRGGTATALSSVGQDTEVSPSGQILAKLGAPGRRRAMLFAGSLALGVFGWLLLRGRGIPPTEPPALPQAMASSVVAPSAMPSNSAITPQPTVDKPLNQLSGAEADGTREKPRVVASDGTGSHRSISLALQDSKPGDWIHVSPGIYEESLQVSKPIHLIGSGDVKSCVIVSAEQSPIQLTCESGVVLIEGLTIRGTGLQTGKEFNAIDVKQGQLKLSHCELKSSTWNCVKLHPGSSLDALECQFQESNLFSISAKQASSVRVEACDFFESGVQTVASDTQILRCRFLGRQGVSLQEPSSIPKVVEGCTFNNCADYAIAITENAKAVVRQSEFKNCNQGIVIGQSLVKVMDVTLDGCKSAAIAISGGKAEITGATKILKARKFGCQVVSAGLTLVGSTFDEIGQSAIIATGDSTVTTDNVSFARCSTSAVDLIQGVLRMKGGSIKSTDEFGIFVAEEAEQATIEGTRFKDNIGGAISFAGGQGTLEDLVIEQSEIGVLARNGTDQPIRLQLKNLEFREISGMAIDLEGDVTVEASALDFGDLPNDRRYQPLNGAQVKLEG